MKADSMPSPSLMASILALIDMTYNVLNSRLLCAGYLSPAPESALLELAGQ